MNVYISRERELRFTIPASGAQIFRTASCLFVFLRIGFGQDMPFNAILGQKATQCSGQDSMNRTVLILESFLVIVRPAYAWFFPARLKTVTILAFTILTFTQDCAALMPYFDPCETYPVLIVCVRQCTSILLTNNAGII